MSAQTLDEIWPLAQSLFQECVRRPSLAKWVQDLRPLSFEGGVLTLTVPSALAKRWLEDKAAQTVTARLSEMVDTPITLVFAVSQLTLGLEPRQEPTAMSVAAAPAAQPVEDFFTSSPLNPKHTFDRYVTGKNSQLAHAAALAVSRAPGKSYNPLFIYGGVGLGKTHLMQAIGHAILAANPKLKVSCISGETFTYHVVNAIREDHFSAFREAYRAVDVWLVDDIQSIATRERTEQEFFQTFNMLHETGKQIIITSDRPPKDLQILDSRLRSRFEWGLMADIKAPDLETRIAILEKKVEIERAVVSTDVVRYIATTVSSNIRVLEGALTRVLAASSILGEPLTVAFAQEQLRDHSTFTGTRALTITDVQEKVMEHFGVTLADLNGGRRTQDLVLPRQIAMYLCRQMLSASFPEIARRFGGRDHSTVIYACNKLEQTIKIDKQMRATVSELTSRLQEAIAG
jgi:chromosomal replication initiator protein